MTIVERAHQLEQILLQLVENKVLPQESYLAGGTAVYFYLSHRLSVDLDFFTPKPFNAEVLIFEMRKLLGQVDVEILEKETLILYLTPEKLKFSLFYLPYPLLSPLTSYQVKPGSFCSLASLDDIGAMKAIAIVQRGSAKDFIDLYSLLQNTSYSFEDLALKVRKKYSVEGKYDYNLKTAMVYFDDAERELDAIWLVDTEKRARKISITKWNEIKSYFVRFCE
jgi:predicted nucleotidyltransferase component of viral defense system